MERQCQHCKLPSFPEGTKISHGNCRSCLIKHYPEYPHLHNIYDPYGTFYVQTGE